jgi:FHS family Na+ dependent glucose MFS transporter 1
LEPALNRNKIIVTAAYYLCFLVMGFSMTSLGPTLPALAQNTQSSLSAISILFTARALGSVIGSVWGGRIYDRLRGHGVMALMIAAVALLTALTPFAAVLFLTGAAQGVLNIGGNTLLVWVHGPNVGPFMSGMHFFFGVGTFLTPIVIAQFLVVDGGLIWTYLLLAALILPAAALAFLPSPSSPHTSHHATSGRIDSRLIVLIALVFGSYSGAATAYGGWIFTYALEMQLATQTNAAYLTSIFWGGLTIGRLAAIPLAVRFRPQTILWADFTGAFLSLLAMLLWPRSLTAVMVTSAGLGFALASIYPTTMSLAGQLMPISGRVTGLFSIGNSAGMMLVPWIIGPFFEIAGPPSMTVILLVDLALALVVLAALARQAPRSVNARAAP